MRRARSRKGQGLVEYAMILVLVAIVVLLALTGLGSVTHDTLLGPAANMMGNAV